MLSLIGLPPLAGFFGKLFLFMEALNAAPQHRLTFLWLVMLALLNKAGNIRTAHLTRAGWRAY